MGYMRHIVRCNAWNPAAYLPFKVGGTQVGYVKPEFARVLADYRDAFLVEPGAVSVAPGLRDAGQRTAAVDAALRDLSARGFLGRWRDEPYAVTTSYAEPALLHMERAAVSRFGVLGFGLHVNGFVRRPGGGIDMWIGRRSLDKPTAPGKLDQLVAGGQPAGLSLADNLVKECAEEADMPADMALSAVPVGAVSYTVELAEGLRRDVLFIYDLETPDGFEPRNTDGEIDHFMLWPIERVMDEVRERDEFKFNCALVIIDFLIRHGLILPEHPEYLDLIRGLRTHDGRIAG